MDKMMHQENNLVTFTSELRPWLFGKTKNQTNKYSYTDYKLLYFFHNMIQQE